MLNNSERGIGNKSVCWGSRISKAKTRELHQEAPFLTSGSVTSGLPQVGADQAEPFGSASGKQAQRGHFRTTHASLRVLSAWSSAGGCERSVDSLLCREWNGRASGGVREPDPGAAGGADPDRRGKRCERGQQRRRLRRRCRERIGAGGGGPSASAHARLRACESAWSGSRVLGAARTGVLVASRV